MIDIRCCGFDSDQFPVALQMVHETAFTQRGHLCIIVEQVTFVSSVTPGPPFGTANSVQALDQIVFH